MACVIQVRTSLDGRRVKARRADALDSSLHCGPFIPAFGGERFLSSESFAAPQSAAAAHPAGPIACRVMERHADKERGTSSFFFTSGISRTSHGLRIFLCSMMAGRRDSEWFGRMAEGDGVAHSQLLWPRAFIVSENDAPERESHLQDSRGNVGAGVYYRPGLALRFPRTSRISAAGHSSRFRLQSFRHQGHRAQSHAGSIKYRIPDRWRHSHNRRFAGARPTADPCDPLAPIRSSVYRRIAGRDTARNADS